MAGELFLGGWLPDPSVALPVPSPCFGILLGYGHGAICAQREAY